MKRIYAVSTCPVAAVFGGALLVACEPPDDAVDSDADGDAAGLVADPADGDVAQELADPGRPDPCPDGVDGEACRPRAGFITQLSLGTNFTCGRYYGGQVRCWGSGWFGALGSGSTQNLGDQPGELPVAAINLGGTALEVGSGWQHACARLDTGNVRCWGFNDYGQLGYGHTNMLGNMPGQMPTPDVNVGAPVKQLAVGMHHTCALLQDGHVRCWGHNSVGQLGYGHTNNIGDAPGEMPPPNVPGITNATQLTAGDAVTCALLQDGSVRCWGYGGVLGLGHANFIGDDPGEMPPPPVNLGPVTIGAISAGGQHVCARTTDYAIKCWGRNVHGELGYGHTNNIGDDPGEMPPPNVNVGGLAFKLATYMDSTCVGLNTGKVRCWGRGDFGSLGYANTQNLGDGPGEMPPPDVNLGTSSIHTLAGGAAPYHACMLDNYFTLRCWGDNLAGKLGYGHTNDIGDNEHPAVAGTVPY